MYDAEMPLAMAGDTFHYVGVSWSRSGWVLHSWNLGTRTRWRQCGLPLQLVLDKVEALNVTLPIYVPDHSNGSSEINLRLRALASALHAAHPECTRVLCKVSWASGFAVSECLSLCRHKDGS